MVEDHFRKAMCAAGINIEVDIHADGEIHRFNIDGDKPGDKNGWYVIYPDGVPAGAFGSWKTGEKHTWCARTDLTVEERRFHQSRIADAMRKRDAALSEIRTEASAQADAMWTSASEDAFEHRYLSNKHVRAYGIRYSGAEILIPLRDTDGKLHSLQRIRSDGSKRFLPGGAISGHYHSIGRPAARLIVCEGYATGATIHESTGDAVAVAFNAGNLEPVSKVLRKKFPDIQIVIAADDDVHTDGNPGVSKALSAARAVDGLIAIPDFGDGRPDGVSDFNDLAALKGGNAVRSQIQAACEHGDEPQSEPTRPDTYVQTQRASGITMEPISWLWQDYIAAGALHVVAGQAGTGKTTIALNLAATVSRGGLWPDGSQAPTGDVFVWSGEDRAEDTLVPRLAATGADLDRIRFIQSVGHAGDREPFDPAVHMQLLHREIAKAQDCRLLIIDPIVSAVSGDSYKNSEVRRGLQPVVDIAQKRGIAVLGITHYSKGGQGKDPLERVTGSIAFGAVARMVFGTGKSTGGDGFNVFTKAKCNIAPDGGGFEYSISYDAVSDGISGSRVVWGAPLEGSARDILGSCEMDESDRDLKDDAIYWLKQELADGPVAAKELQKRAKEAGHSWSTIRRAKLNAGVVSERESFHGGWRWLISQDAHSTCDEHLGDSDRLKPAPHKGFTQDAHTEDVMSILGDESPQDAHAAKVLTPRANGSQDAHLASTMSTLVETRATQGFERVGPPQDAHLLVNEHLGNEEAF